MGVFFNTCAGVKFHSDMLKCLNTKVMKIHGKQKQSKRTATFLQFCRVRTGILFCTNVGARGLDIPEVDWIIHYDPPNHLNEYIHRVGRTARGLFSYGRSLLFLLPEEINFIKHLRELQTMESIPLKEYQLQEHRMDIKQSDLEKLVTTRYHLYQSAKTALRSHLEAYSKLNLRDSFDI